MHILLIDQRTSRSTELTRVLEEVGHVVVAQARAPLDLGGLVSECDPDVVVFDVASPDPDTFDGMTRLEQEQRRPIVLFVDESDGPSIKKAVEAGVAAYVVKGAQPERVRSVLEVAMARFESHRALVDELAEAKSTLEERKIVERAKGLLMKKRQVSEEEAYAMMRKMAMDKSLRLVDVGRRVMEMSEVL